MSNLTIRIATRKSPLALQQTKHVASCIKAIAPEYHIELKTFQTQGDKFLNQSLSKIGGKGLFVKELEQALLNNEADIAVHSMKDVPYELPAGLAIKAILAREDARDAFLSVSHPSLEMLPANATIGTSSLRRACQLKALRSDLKIEPLRGNINTRIAKMNQFDAIILASAGLIRMGFTDQIKHYLDTNLSLPAAGQGALGIECRKDDHPLIELLQKLTCQQTKQCVLAERGVITTLQGSCQVPLAAYAHSTDNAISLSALIAHPDGSGMIKANSTGLEHLEPSELGKAVAQQLLSQGAQPILDRYR